MTIRVLVVDDHSVVRQGLRMFLELDDQIEIIGEAVDGVDALEKARSLQPEVILMDILMPRMDGITAIKHLRSENPEIEIIALTSVLDDKIIVDAVREGAIGYLLKDTEADRLCDAVKAAAAGQVQLSPQVASRLMKELRISADEHHLTDREAEILCDLARGLSNQEIAEKRYIAVKTVKAHVSNILGKLHLPSRTRAAIYAIKKGLVSLDEL